MIQRNTLWQDPISGKYRRHIKVWSHAVRIEFVFRERADILDTSTFESVRVRGICILPEPPDAVYIL